jgi:carbohydrate-selective porin OprB
MQIEQLIFRENACEETDPQGLGAFASYFPRFANGVIPVPVVWGDFVAGIVYRGLIPCRDEDVIGAGVAWAKLNRSGTLQETAIELFYKARITPCLTLQPDIQYIATPSGLHRDAIAVGLRFQLNL